MNSERNIPFASWEDLLVYAILMDEPAVAVDYFETEDDSRTENADSDEGDDTNDGENSSDETPTA